MLLLRECPGMPELLGAGAMDPMGTPPLPAARHLDGGHSVSAGTCVVL